MAAFVFAATCSPRCLPLRGVRSCPCQVLLSRWREMPHLIPKTHRIDATSDNYRSLHIEQQHVNDIWVCHPHPWCFRLFISADARFVRYNPAIDRPQFASCNAIIVVPLTRLLGPSIGCLQVFNPIGKKGFGRDDLTACKLWVKKISPLLKNYKPISISKKWPILIICS